MLDQAPSLSIVTAAPPAEDALVEALRSKFHLDDFRKGQRPIIESVLQGRDTVAVMPTGGGKSLCYQLPAFVQDRLVIVISPLIALMQDQVRGLRALGLRSGCLHSGQDDESKREVFRDIAKGGGYLLYLSPERVQKPGFADWVRRQNVGLFAIDEAHCVSQWGPDFRPDFAKLNLLRELKRSTPILALTATATPTVLEDVIASLGLRDPERVVRGFYRPNLFYQVTVCADDEQKVDMIKTAIRATPEGRILIYCGTRNACESLSMDLARDWDGVGYYHAGLSAEDRVDTQRKLDRGELRIVCATNAFGMGIDYPNVRLVVHYQMPANVESFYQEMGRAGRDGKVSLCLLLYSKKDRALQSFFIQQSKAEKRVINSKWRALDAMTMFAEGGECRHAGVLTYFRDADRIEACGHCDICVPASSMVIVRPEPRPPVRAVRVRKARDRKASSSPAEELNSPEAELRAEQLKAWRRQHAKKNDIAAFIVFSNRTLIDLANRDPSSHTELLKVYGFGPQKSEAFGQEILQLLETLR